MKNLLFIFLMLMGLSAVAQKLPNIQTASVRAPADIKIDGKATEWNDQFQAHNNNTNVWYTVSNDDDNLYFIIQAREEVVIHKMMRGCVSIIINTTGKKNSKNAMSITFPSYLPKDAPNVSLSNKPKPMADTIKFKMKTDSFMHLMNTRLSKKEKFIVVSGLKEITDSLVSVYNEDGIKAKILLDGQLNYNYELAVPLKYLGLSTTDPKKFSYNVMLNGIIPKGATTEMVGRGSRVLVTSPGQPPAMMMTNTRNDVMMYPTDFWGQYTLAKK